MQVQATDQTFFRRTPHTCALWELRQLSSTEAGRNRLQELTGVPHSAISYILDTDFQSAVNPTWGIQKRSLNGAKLYGRLAALGNPSRELTTDPIFWLLRIRRYIREATRSLTPLQRDQKLRLPPALPKEHGPSPIPYLAMASWAYQYYGNKPADDQIYGEIFVQGQQESYRHVRYFRDPSTRHWFLWRAALSKIGRDQVFDALPASYAFPMEEPTLASGPMDSESIPF